MKRNKARRKIDFVDQRRLSGIYCQGKAPVKGRTDSKEGIQKYRKRQKVAEGQACRGKLDLGNGDGDHKEVEEP